MSANRISTTIPGDVVTRVTENLNQIKTLLQPYVQGLTVQERRRLPKMGDDSFTFVSKVTDYCNSNPEFCPSYVDVDELATDFSLADELKTVRDLCEQIFSNVDDTILLAGSEAYASSLMYYGSVKGAAKTGQANAKPIYDDLRQRFSGMGKKKTAGNGNRQQ